MKKGLTKVCALSMAAAMLATGCGSSTTTTQQTTAAAKAETTAAAAAETKATEAATEAPKEIVDITVMVYDRGREYTNGNSVTDNEFTRWVNEQLEPQGVHVTYVPVPRSGADDKVNLMLTGGTAPDVIRTYDRQRVATYGSQGGLVDLTPYIDRLDPEYLELAESVMDYHVFDGAQYSLPGLYAGRHGKGHEMFIRQDLVEGMGMEMPTNKEELIEVLYAMKENYPDITPYAFGGKVTDGNFTNWITSYTSRANERDNYIYEPTFTIVLKPGHKEGLKQLNQFVLDGIIDPNFALDVDNAKYDQAIANGSVGFVMDGDDTCIDGAYDSSGVEGYKMVAWDALDNVDGNCEVRSQDPFSHYVYVPATAEDRIDAVMTYLAFISNPDISLDISNGLEGLGYEIVDGEIKGFDRATRLANGTSGDPSDNSFMYSNHPSENVEQAKKSYILSNPEVPEDVAIGKIEAQYSNYFDKMLIGGALETDEYAPLLQELICKFVFKCMTAPEGQFDAVYEKEYQVLVDNHLQEVLDERAAWYDANIAK